MNEHNWAKSGGKTTTENITWIFSKKYKLWVPQEKKQKWLRRWKAFEAKVPFNWFNVIGVLIIPFVLFYAAQQITQQQTLLSKQQHDSDQAIALDQQRAAILQTYIDNIQDLLLNHNLRNSRPDDEVVTLARARTLTALKGLDTDTERKSRLVQFIYDAHLIGFLDNKFKSHSPIFLLVGANLGGTTLVDINLSYANLGGNNLSDVHLQGSYLKGIILSGEANLGVAELGSTSYLNGTVLSGITNLSSADLRTTDLDSADLVEVNLEGAHLERAILWSANLDSADLKGTHFMYADLKGAKLKHADLSRTDITQQQLDQVYTCLHAILPKGLICHHQTP